MFVQWPHYIQRKLSCYWDFQMHSGRKMNVPRFEASFCLSAVHQLSYCPHSWTCQKISHKYTLIQIGFIDIYFIRLDAMVCFKLFYYIMFVLYKCLQLIYYSFIWRFDSQFWKPLDNKYLIIWTSFWCESYEAGIILLSVTRNIPKVQYPKLLFLIAHKSSRSDWK